MKISPVKIWRRSKSDTKYIGETGTILSVTVIRVAPNGFYHQAPYPVVLVKMKNGKNFIGQLVDYQEKDLEKGKSVIAVLRRMYVGDREGIIPYIIKFKPL